VIIDSTARNRKKEAEYDNEKHKKHGLIERVFGKLKENRRLAVRYEKPDINFLGFIVIAFLKIFLCSQCLIEKDEVDRQEEGSLIRQVCGCGLGEARFISTLDSRFSPKDNNSKIYG
jgi:hypothetical protein